eukprot:gene3743-4662_t
MEKIKLYFDTTNSENIKILDQCWSLYQKVDKESIGDVVNETNQENEDPTKPSVENNASYQPPFYLYNNHIMNIYSVYGRRALKLKSKRDTITNKNDGGTVSLDWYDFGVEFPEDAPTIVILHGLTGGSQEKYIQYLALEAFKSKAQFRTIVFNYRGCAGNKVTADMGYCATQTDDLKQVIEIIQERIPNAPLFLVGFSLGSAILVNYMSQVGESSPFIAHVSISNPMNMIASSVNLRSSYLNNTLYNKTLAQNLKRLFNRFGNRMDKYISAEEMEKCNSIYDFDNAITHKMFGYDSVEHYYTTAGAINHIDRLKKPILFLNAVDDPISPMIDIPYEKFKSNPNTILAVTQWGAHLGFLTSSQESWADAAIIEYLSAFLKK